MFLSFAVNVLLSSESSVITVSYHFGRSSVLISLVGYRHFPEVFPDNVGIEKLALVAGSRGHGQCGRRCRPGCPND